MESRKYIFAFLITLAIFVTAIFASNYLNNKKLEDVRAVENRVSMDILSSETQFSLLEETSCKNIGPGFLSKSLGELADKLSYAEHQSGFNSAEVVELKRSYTLLEIKDYLLMKRLSEKCNIHPTFVLYFYSADEGCKDCQKAGFVLDALRDKYPDLRVYSFDYDLDLDAMKTLISIYNVKGQLPAFIINGDPYYGYRSLEDLETNVPAIHRLEVEFEKAQAASSTNATTSSIKQ
jgi:hypothetical protein